jgi:hypothetical protein
MRRCGSGVAESGNAVLSQLWPTPDRRGRDWIVWRCRAGCHHFLDAGGVFGLFGVQGRAEEVRARDLVAVAVGGRHQRRVGPVLGCLWFGRARSTPPRPASRHDQGQPTTQTQPTIIDVDPRKAGESKV